MKYKMLLGGAIGFLIASLIGYFILPKGTIFLGVVTGFVCTSIGWWTGLYFSE